MKFHLFALLMLCSISFSSLKTFIRDYTYIAGETDSKLSSRQKAESEVKRLLLQELGMYILSVTIIEDHVLTLDDIISVSAGLTKSKILDEKWTGESYWIEMEIQADPEDIEKEVKKFVANNIEFERNKLKMKGNSNKDIKVRYGIPFAVMGEAKYSFKGISLPLISGPGPFIDFSGISLGGLVGANTRGEFNGLSIGFFNVSKKHNGLAVGVFNMSEKIKGIQIGGFNSVFPRDTGDKYGQEVNGMQIGLINKAKKLKGIQIGIFNTAENAWLPVMIGFNFAF